MSLLTFVLKIIQCFFTLFSIKTVQVTICNMALCLILPNVSWKIENVSGYCKRKSPYFTFQNTKWQLKFVYYKTPQDIEVCQISLKCSGNESTSNNITITSWCTFAGTQCFERTMKYNYSELNEMAIFRETLKSFKENRAIENYFTSICEFWEKSFFVCSFTIKNWAPIPKGPKIKDMNSTGVLKSSSIASLCYDFEKLFDSHEMSDVTLISKDQTFYAHKNILSARSDVFAAMFRNNTKESVDLTHIDSAVLESFLRYLYSGKVPELSHENVHQLYTAAQTYAVKALQLKCATFMIRNIDTETSSEVSEAGDKLCNDCKVQETILSHFGNIKAVLSTEAWKKLAKCEPKFAHEVFDFFVSKTDS